MGVGVELKGGKKPEQGRFLNFFFLAKGSQRREGKEENYNPWFRLSYAGKYIFLASPHAKKKKKKATWNYALTPTMLCQLSAFCV